MDRKIRIFVFQHQNRSYQIKTYIRDIHKFDKFILDRCDAKVSCYRIRDERLENRASFSIEDEVFTKCTTFNIHLEADLGQRVIRDEISLANKWVNIFVNKSKRFGNLRRSRKLLLNDMSSNELSHRGGRFIFH